MTPTLELWLTGTGVALLLMIAVWLLSLVRRDAGIVDAFWGLGFVLLAWTYHAGTAGPVFPRIVTPVLVTVWGLRLSLHIAWRGRGQPEDYRYADMRRRHGALFPLVSLFTVFLLQGALLGLISVPLLHAQRVTTVGPLHGVAVAVFVFGFLFEAVGDLQLARFRGDPANEGKVMSSGLWRFTRHPNYFGDAVVWWSYFLLALPAPGAWWVVLSPMLMTFLLMKVSGVTLLEKKLDSTRPGYAEYIRRTPAFFPWFPDSAGAPPKQGDRRR